MCWSVVRTLVTVALAVALLGTAAAQRSASTTGRQDLVGREFEARVTRIADGDTVEAILQGELRPIRIRLEGVDAPEQGEAFGREAMAALRTLLFGQQVRVRGRGLDRYGRLVARLLRGDVDASTRLVRTGLACHAYAYDAALARAEADARQARAGFWAPNARQPACVTNTAFSAQREEWRPSAGTTASTKTVTTPAPRARTDGGDGAQAPTGPFRGNTSSLLYHASTCPNFTCRNCTRVFSTEVEAKTAGFRPAGDCLKP